MNQLNARIVPNPVREQLHISIYSSIAAPAELVIIDATGAAILRIHKALLKGENNLDYLLGHQFPSGIYFIKIFSAGLTVTSKFYKN